MLSLDEISQSVRNNIQLVLDHVGLPLAVGPISDDDYRILCGGFGELEWDWALSTYGNSPSKYEFCIKLVEQSVTQRVPSGAAICVYDSDDNIFNIHMIERFSSGIEEHPLKGRMTLITLMSAYIFCKAVDCNEVRIVEPVPELRDFYSSFGFNQISCGYVMVAEASDLECAFSKFI
ncbi:MAG: hypothetical protein ACRC9O_03255 [Plesiomonas sp.]|uniref:hypothetical protein n=1 Tax=Plesiomonas sp. TaxID=2486279 RepID=UPI003F3FD42C